MQQCVWKYIKFTTKFGLKILVTPYFYGTLQIDIKE